MSASVSKDVETGNTEKRISLSINGAADPFEPREGKVLTWTDINMTLTGKNGKEDRQLLSGVWGQVPKKEITAIMGPSGAGKTSLLNILAGRTRSRGPLKVVADVRLNNFTVDPTNLEVRKQIAFVAQDDSLMATSTPREAIKFSSKLRLPRSVTDKELDVLVEKMLQELGLTHCADTLVGGELIKGISGGERKRTSVGVELVVKPALVFLDEPTSGLDSFSAVQLVHVLHKVANAGSSVLFTIHQPASEIFNSFNHLLLMNKGRVMYQGSISTVSSYFGDRGKPLPANYNPADWIMNVAQELSMEELNDAGFFPENELHVEKARNAEEFEGVDELGISKHSDVNISDKKKGVTVLTQTRMLYQREIQNLKRDKASVGARFGITIFLNILFGLIFRNIGKNSSEEQINLQSHFGALIMVLLSTMFGTAQPALFGIPAERPVFLREYSTNHYSVLPYFLSRLSIEAVITFVQVMVQNLISYFLIGFQASFIKFQAITYTLAMASTAVAVLLGCSVEDAKMGQELLPLLFVPQMLFAGFFVATTLLPAWLRWCQYLCSLTYGVRLIVLAEFEDCASGSDQAADNCNRLLDGLNAEQDEEWWTWLILIGLFVVLRLAALYVLRTKANKFY